VSGSVICPCKNFKKSVDVLQSQQLTKVGHFLDSVEKIILVKDENTNRQALAGANRSCSASVAFSLQPKQCALICHC